MGSNWLAKAYNGSSIRMDIITLKNVVVFFKHSSPLLRIDLKSHTGTITGVYSLIYIKSWTKGKSWIVELKKIIKLKMKVYQQKKNIRKKNLHFHAQWALNICAVDGNLFCFTHFRHIFFCVFGNMNNRVGCIDGLNRY